MFYVLYGDDEFTRDQELARFRDRVLQDKAGELNVTVLEGENLNIQELINAASTPPFLAQRRLIIAKGLLARLGKPSLTAKEGTDSSPELKRLIDYLPNLPKTTRLFFVEDELPQTHPVLQLAQSLPTGHVRQYVRPDLRTTAGRNRLSNWIRRRAQAKGAPIQESAISLLVNAVGNDLRRLDQELEKLAAYTGYRRTIARQDVHALVATSLESNIFALVDALGMRNQRAAIRELERLYAQDAGDLYILTMMARQIRLLIAVKDLTQVKAPRRQIRETLHISRQFIVDKLLQQAPLFEQQELSKILERLREIDEAIKTGKTSGKLALEILVIEVCIQRNQKRIKALRTRRASSSSRSSPEARSR